MNIDSAMSSAHVGIRKGYTDMSSNAAEIASARSGDPADLARPLVNIETSRLAIEASAKVMKTLDDTLGTFIDTVA